MNTSISKVRIVSVCENPIVGDIDGNLALARFRIREAIGNSADIVLFSELYIIGYPPEDLVLKPSAVIDCRVAIEELAIEFANGPMILIGTPWREDNKLYNAMAVLLNGKYELRYKYELPNYDVFDEKRVFVSGSDFKPIIYQDKLIGLPICEDIWFEKTCAELKKHGAQILLVPNGSPYRRGAFEKRRELAKWRIGDNKIPLVYLNQFGGQDELCFDGGAFIATIDGEIHEHISHFEAGTGISDWEVIDGEWQLRNATSAILTCTQERDYSAAVVALRDYVNKNKFPGVLLGLSGGIDSAISAAIAVDALGSDRVICVMMPSKFTGEESLSDAKNCANALGVRYEIVSIEGAVTAFESTLAGQFAGKARDTTEENIQSRARAVILMAMSNKFGHMVLTTGNKSEMAVGYATLYGDMCGGYNCLKDFYKTEVFALTKWRNENKPKIGLGPVGIVVPHNIIEKPPSAELRENQKDQDSLPPYDKLDDMLYALVELEEEIEDVIARGHAPETVRRIQHLLYLAEYKRRQAPPGVKIGPKNFGRDRRYPITNRYRDKE
jgi:NAD+ synthase